MSVTSETAQSGPYDGNNSTVSAYVVDFDFLKNTDLYVTKTFKETGVVTPLVYLTDYTVTGGEGGGAIKTTVAVPNTYEITISRGIPLVQPYVFAEGQRIPMKTLETALDMVVMEIQRVKGDANAAIAIIAQALAELDAVYVIQTTPPTQHDVIWFDPETWKAAVWNGNSWTAFYGAGSGTGGDSIIPLPVPVEDRAEIWDNFHRADTPAGTVSNAPTGQTYEIRTSGGVLGPGTSGIRILNNELVANPATVWYMGGEMLQTPCFNMGAEVTWSVPSSPVGSGFTQLVFIIKPNAAFLNNFIHVRISRYEVALEITENFSVDGLELLQTTLGTNYSVAPFYRTADGTSTAIYQIVINNDCCQILCDGKILIDVQDPRIVSCNGKWLYWEQFGGASFDVMKVNKIWANDKRAIGLAPDQAVMPMSGYLRSMSNGNLRSWGDLVVHKGSVNVLEGVVSARELRVRINEAAGGGTLGRTATRPAGGVSVTATGNAAGSGNTTVGAWNSTPYTINGNGDRYSVVVNGIFAANGNNKVVKYNWVGGDVFTTGTLTTSGGAWRLEVQIWKSAANNWNFHFVFSHNGGIITGTHSAATVLNLTLAHAIVAQGVAANDVVCQSLFVNHDQ